MGLIVLVSWIGYDLRGEYGNFMSNDDLIFEITDTDIMLFKEFLIQKIDYGSTPFEIKQCIDLLERIEKYFAEKNSVNE